MTGGPLARAGGPARRFVVALARAFGGAIFFALPLLMTMEMWWLGFYMDRLRLALFLAAFIPLLVGLSHFAGFEPTETWLDDVRDAFVALVVGFVTAASALALAGLLRPEMATDEMIGMVALEAIPASVGAALAAGILGGSDEELMHEEQPRYAGELFLMAAGAVFFAFNVAPTEEMIVIGFKMSPWHVVAAAVASLALMHAFVYAVEFHGQERAPEGAHPWGIFLRFTVVGYAIALLVSAYVLWTFGRFDDAGPASVVATTVVLALPASLGAAAARLVL
ncbi:MAG TPA: TIGR02587 family membrane protein [Gemmatimonadaceae bacterium]|nr:TIGR02587 family membrane protein [Gemmatimonadaceae bacterium]